VSPARVFVTGGAGFIGRSLLHELHAAGIAITLLDRSGAIRPEDLAPDDRVVRGSLLVPESYRAALAGCDAVLHLAAATGKASRGAHHDDTVQATRELCAAARAAGVERLLYVSSIAVAFHDREGYPYAQAKAEAEAVVKASGLRHAIVRPTIVLGKGAPILKSLSSLALLPAIVLPGTGQVRVQPIAVEDVARQLVAMVRAGHFVDTTRELGGPEVLTMEELLQRLREARTGRRGRVVHIPLPILQGPLRLAEWIGLRGILPVTAGQLTSFREDGVAVDASPDGLIPVREMLPSSRDEASGDAPAGDRECDAFTRHLVGQPPDEITRAAYRQAVATVAALQPVGRQDRAILAFARRHALATRLADSWSALFSRSSVLRKRLVMLLAILESHAPTHAAIDRPAGGSPAGAVTMLLLRGLLAVLLLVVGTIVMIPVMVFGGHGGGNA